MKELIKQNYKSIVARGLITPSTTKSEFLDKIFEEVSELEEALINNDWRNIEEELSDVILTVLNMAEHYNIDIEKQLKQKVKTNFNRAN